MDLPGGLKIGQKLNLVKADGTMQECECVGGGVLRDRTTKALEEHAFIEYADKGVTFTEKVNLDKLSL